MTKIALPAAFELLLAMPAANADELPPMDVMSPFDTPASVAERSPVPEPQSDASRRRGNDAGLENALAIPPASPPPFMDFATGIGHGEYRDDFAGGRREKKPHRGD
jgi:hypothetical protein